MATLSVKMTGDEPKAEQLPDFAAKLRSYI